MQDEMKALIASAISWALAAISLIILTTACVDSPQPQSMPPRAAVAAPALTNTTATGDPADIFQSAAAAMNALSSYRAEMEYVVTGIAGAPGEVRTEIRADVRPPDAMGGDIAITLSEAGGGAADLGEPYEADQLIAAAQDMDAYESDWQNNRINVIGTVDDVSRGRVYLSTGFGENVVALNDLSEAALAEVEVGGAVEFACVIGEYAREAISMTQCGPAQHGADASGETFIVSNKFTIIRLPDAMGGDMTIAMLGEPPIAGGGAADLGEPYEANQLIAAAQHDTDAYEADWMNKRVNVIGAVDEVSRRRVYLSTGFGENAVALEDLSNAALEEIQVGETVEFACVIGEYAREAVHMTQCGPAEHGADNAGAGGESDATAIIANGFIVIGDEAYIA